MERASRSMQAFRSDLIRRSRLIEKAASLDSLEFGPVVDLAFTVTAKWSGGNPGEYSKTYFHGKVFRYRGTMSSVLKYSACRFRHELVREILQARGIR